ncbi:MAG: response regulator [Ruminococcus sp.]|uniref:hybrid sensor histidine kinase/response regulator n=1 Tax=Ruminococcus sp. TaxID=41978 RepID=UPI0028731928|nr:response regulator [Ruminococcus sp.]MBQ3285079.1 response regulator [Ruminococcus sp.]
MKRIVIIVNAIIMAAILVFVVLYSQFESKDTYSRQIEHFQNITVTMEHVTENYLEGEQRICDVWARYINNNPMTMEEAHEFICSSRVLENTSAHLVYRDTLTGLSTRPKQGAADDYTVTYQRIDLLEDVSWINEIGESINVSRAYTNPMNGEQSLAFCDRVTLKDPDSSAPVEAILLRVIPVLELEQKWVFPQEEFANAELSMIDSKGDYILKGYSFKNSNFFEFYKSYNPSDPASSKALFDKITSATGSLSMVNSHGEECILAYTPLTDSVGWTLLGFVPAKDLSGGIENWLLVGTVSAGLLILFLFDLLYMLNLNKRLQVTAKEAENANKAKTDFLSAMSHDIRTPMNAIIGLTTIAENNLGDVASTGESIRKIRLAGNHLLTLINDILDISKVESGKLKLTPLTFSIEETVENLINISQPMVKEKNIDFTFWINGMEKEYLHTDQLRLNQIYINILSNAVKYTEPGGSVNVELREEESAVPGCIQLTYVVADTGIGMSPEYMATMYQPFSRQIDSRVNKIQGTGLGLAITKQMVELLGGTIECQSEEGKGTTFTVVLDIPAADRQRDNLRLEPVDVLVVDDDESTLTTAADTLEALGASAQQARSGAEAISMIEQKHLSGRDYDVVIVDWKMSGTDGIETIRRISSNAEWKIPFLLISAYDWSDIEDKAKEAGATGFIRKPFFRSTLYEKINDLTGNNSDSREPEDDYSDLQGLHILIAEDNDINWEIISAMLGMFGITTDRAENGRVCVDMINSAAEGSYEMIFMDVQMPEMNGLDATRAIRSSENPWVSSIPIVAMTADAFSENVAECLNAGMNGHIAKPVDIKLVIKEIRRIKERREQS